MPFSAPARSDTDRSDKELLYACPAIDVPFVDTGDYSIEHTQSKAYA